LVLLFLVRIRREETHRDNHWKWLHNGGSNIEIEEKSGKSDSHMLEREELLCVIWGIKRKKIKEGSENGTCR
jgi:hypothetical protein